MKEERYHTNSGEKPEHALLEVSPGVVTGVRLASGPLTVIWRGANASFPRGAAIRDAPAVEETGDGELLRPKTHE